MDLCAVIALPKPFLCTKVFHLTLKKTGKKMSKKTSKTLPDSYEKTGKNG
jgi:hypothetical protein